MTVQGGWQLVTTVTNLLSLLTWGFPIFSLAVLSYCIEHYTRYRTRWRMYLVSTLFALSYPVSTSLDYWIYGDALIERQLYASALLLVGLLIASLASLKLLEFQKIDLGKTRHTIYALALIGVSTPLIGSIAFSFWGKTVIHLITYNLSVSLMVLLYLAVGKLTKNYISRFRLFAYSSARIGSIFLLIDPVLRNYVYLAAVDLPVKYGLRLVAVLSQCFAILLLLFTVVMLILEAQARGVHLIPSGERTRWKKPITYRLKKGYGYLLKEDNPSLSYDVFIEYLGHHHHGLVFCREKPTRIRHNYGLNTTPILWMTNAETDEKSVKPRDLQRITMVIRDFVKYDTDSIILIQRLDYLITENDFKKVLKLIHNLNDIVMSSKCILLVSVNPHTLTRDKLELLAQELKDLTDIDNVALGEPLYSLLLFVYSENERRRTPSFKGVTKRFSITKTTARKRIRELQGKGLLDILKEGRYKFLEVTEKGKRIIRNPATLTGGGEND